MNEDRYMFNLTESQTQTLISYTKLCSNLEIDWYSSRVISGYIISISKKFYWLKMLIENSTENLDFYEFNRRCHIADKIANKHDDENYMNTINSIARLAGVVGLKNFMKDEN